MLTKYSLTGGKITKLSKLEQAIKGAKRIGQQISGLKKKLEKAGLSISSVTSYTAREQKRVVKNLKRRLDGISQNLANLWAKSDNVKQKISEVKSEIADLQDEMRKLMDKQAFLEAEHAGLVSEDGDLQLLL